MDTVSKSRWYAQELISHVKNLNPRCHSKISILSGIIWILITGAQWSALPIIIHNQFGFTPGIR